MKDSQLQSSRAGFSIVELLVSLALSILVVMVVFSIYVINQNAWAITTLTINSSKTASAGLERMVYGSGGPSLRSQDADDVTLTVDPLGSGAWQLDYDSGARSVAYNPVAGTIVNQGGAVLCDNLQACTATLQNGGVLFDITVNETAGTHASTSTMSSFVRFRN